MVPITINKYKIADFFKILVSKMMLANLEI